MSPSSILSIFHTPKPPSYLDMSVEEYRRVLRLISLIRLGPSHYPAAKELISDGVHWWSPLPANYTHAEDIRRPICFLVWHVYTTTKSEDADAFRAMEDLVAYMLNHFLYAGLTKQAVEEMNRTAFRAVQEVCLRGGYARRRNLLKGGELRYHGIMKTFDNRLAKPFEMVDNGSGFHPLPGTPAGPRPLWGKEPLCCVCGVIDWQGRQATKIPGSSETDSNFNPVHHDLGFVEDMVLTTDCALCRLITAALSQSQAIVSIDPQARRRLRCYIPNIGIIATDEGPRRVFWELPIRIELQGPGPKPAMLYFPSFRLDYADVGQIRTAAGAFQLARKVDVGQCNPRFIRKSFRGCLLFHPSDIPRGGAICTRRRETLPDDDLDQLPPCMRVIDFAQQCIVSAPASPDFEFAALSYVWGRAPSFQLTTANLQLLTTPGGITKVLPSLPQTIVDAMTATIHAGIQYLWVDALCIIQDSPADKAAQISCMGTIYSCASLTIVAASGDSSAAGLPGILSTRRDPAVAAQHTEVVSNLTFHTMPPTLRESLAQSPWSTRGWTYQEYILSRRLLIFTPSRVYFVCAHNATCEDTENMSAEAKADLASQGGFEDALPFGGMDPRTVQPQREFEPGPRPWGTYVNLVENYTPRQLTVEGDVVAAVEGILRVLTKRMVRSFLVVGMPEYCFEKALMWFHTGAGPVRRRLPPPVGQVGRFPSWAWAGWVGGASYAQRIETDECKKEVKDWWLVSENSPEAVRLDSDHFEKEHMFILMKSRVAEMQKRRENPSRHLWTVFEQCLLKVTSRLAWFHADLQPEAAKGYLSDHPGAKVYRVYAWIPHSGIKKHVGSIVCTDEQADEQRRWAEGIGRGAHAVPMRCVILSSTKRAWDVLDIDDPREVVRIYDENEFAHHGKDEKLVYNVMWVRAETSPATYMSRITVGQIHIDGWGLGQEQTEEERLYG
ncbi:heterokaryon incompatibility protein-domain-containing protein [Podospora aff. communis PSN243]|uniref:Heterokaryon incompatibility protein-domain-containing protein n=1 Tax=Podospora aff. communis PSN243 TaxID=3040156 RepID=A0AAV9GXU5_9PEZI|nr:heterokaryon incompatibility protein-domain-containing protein [Podospora aff. communis PSN243]